VTAPPEGLGQLRKALVADAEGFHAHRRQHQTIREGAEGKVRRSPQAVACRKRGAQELGKPQRLLGVNPTEDGRQLLRHGRGNPDTEPGWNLRAAVAPLSGKRRRLVSGTTRCMLLGCLIMQRTLRWGKPATWGRP
jgi:hypothetical protein